MGSYKSDETLDYIEAISVEDFLDNPGAALAAVQASKRPVVISCRFSDAKLDDMAIAALVPARNVEEGPPAADRRPAPML